MSTPNCPHQDPAHRGSSDSAPFPGHPAAPGNAPASGRSRWLRGINLLVVVLAGIAAAALILLLIWGPSGGTTLRFSPRVTMVIFAVFVIASALLLPVFLGVLYRSRRIHQDKIGRRLFAIVSGILVVAWELMLGGMVLGVLFSYAGPCEMRTIQGVEYYECNVGFMDRRYFYYESRGPFMMNRDAIDGGEYPVPDDADLFAPEPDEW